MHGLRRRAIIATKRATVWADPVVFRWHPRRSKARQSLSFLARPMDIKARHTALSLIFLLKLIGSFRIRFNAARSDNGLQHLYKRSKLPPAFAKSSVLNGSQLMAKRDADRQVVLRSTG